MIKKFFLAILAPLLLWLAWPPMPLPITIFFGILPWLYLEKSLRSSSKWAFWGFFYLSFCLFNIAIAWWVWNSSPGGAVMMVLVNAFFMTLPWALYRFTQRKLQGGLPYLLLILSWLSLEFVHYHWDINFPWLNFGNAFASIPQWVQWYEYTGVLGGSLWVLLLNILLFQFFESRSKSKLLLHFPLFLLPIFLSYYIGFKTPIQQGKPLQVVCLQPSFDPWHEKFERDPLDLLREMLALSEKYVDSGTDLLLLPETSLTQTIDTRYASNDVQILWLRKFSEKYPSLRILTGADMQEIYYAKNRPNSTARKSENGIYYDFYNSAIFLDKKYNPSWYHKSVLVPGSEQMPLLHLFPSIEKLSIDLGGIRGSLGKSKKAQALGDQEIQIAPIICYESVFGEYCGSYFQKNTNAMGIITNDAWWGNTPGYKQHLLYGSLRAIEQRKWIARSANTGISCLISPRGEILNATKWWDKTAAKGTIYLNTDATFYRKYGDYLGRTAAFSFIILMLVLPYILFRRKKQSTT